MKKYLIFVASIAMAACSNDDTVSNVFDDNVISLSSSLCKQTRAANNLLETNFANGTTVKVQVTDVGTNPIPYEAVNYTANGSGGMTPASTQYYPASGNAVTAYAYYPSDASMAANGFAVATDQSGDAAYQYSDLMFVPAISLTKGTTNTLAFQHALSKVVVTLIAGTGFDASVLSAATVVLKSVKYKGTFSPSATATISNVFTAASDVSDITITTAASTTAHAAIVVPQDVSSKTIAVSIAGKTMEYTIPTSTTFAVGTVNSYTITVTKTGITASSSIAAWNTGTSGSETLIY